MNEFDIPLSRSLQHLHYRVHAITLCHIILYHIHYVTYHMLYYVLLLYHITFYILFDVMPKLFILIHYNPL